MTSQMALCVKTQPEEKKWSRISGWSYPLHLLQLLAWIFLIMFALLFFGVLVPSLPSGACQISCATLNAIVFLCHIIVHLISISLNPADPNVRVKNYRGPLPDFNRNQHAHVIENQFCYICEVTVGKKSKHCSACNKCVSSFDHHCKWLNNCIGGRNYKLFILCVASALMGCLIILLTSLALISGYFINNSWLNKPEHFLELTTKSPTDYSSTLNPFELNQDYLNKNSNFTGSFYVFIPVTGFVWIFFVILTSCLSFIAVCLLTHLLGFHFYLMCIGLSTYEYIVQKRDSETTNTNNKCCCAENCKNTFLQRNLKKANQISPAISGITEEIEMKPTPQTRAPTPPSDAPMVTVTNDIHQPSTRLNPLENYSVYLGSPHRHFLEPIYKQQNKTNMQDSIEKDPEPICVSSMEASESRIRHSSSTLPPIFEPKKETTWYRSVSALSLNNLSQSVQSLNNLSEDETPTTMNNKRINSSLSNLLFSQSQEEVVSDDSENHSTTGEDSLQPIEQMEQFKTNSSPKEEERRLEKERKINKPEEIIAFQRNNYFSVPILFNHSNTILRDFYTQEEFVMQEENSRNSLFFENQSSTPVV